MTVKRMILFGFGSVGERHYNNLRVLRPQVELVVLDPPKGLTATTDANFDAAIIASPTREHAGHMRALTDWGVPFYVEKPLHSVGQTVKIIPREDGQEVPCAVGHQYRFAAPMPEIAAAARKHGILHFRASDSLLEKYGPDVDSVIACHPIDTSLWLLGPAKYTALVSDGLHFTGTIEHERGTSTHDYRIDAGQRVSTVTSGKTYDLPADNQMYLDALAAWLNWCEGGERDPRTATLADGLAVMDVLSKVRHADS